MEIMLGSTFVIHCLILTNIHINPKGLKKCAAKNVTPLGKHHLEKILGSMDCYTDVCYFTE